MAMETRSSVRATCMSVQSIVKAVGVSTVTVLLHVEVESRNVSSASPLKPPTVEQPAKWQLVLRKSMPAAQNHARLIARVTGRIGVIAPMVAMVQMVQNVVQEANKVEFSKLTLPPPQVDATATTNMATSTPDLATFLAAQKIAKVPGVPLVSVLVPVQVFESLRMAMERQRSSAAEAVKRPSLFR
jgi:hypothetical protein